MLGSVFFFVGVSVVCCFLAQMSVHRLRFPREEEEHGMSESGVG